MGFINSIIRQFEKHADSPNGTKYILKLINCLSKGVLKTDCITNLYQLQQRLYYIFTQEMGGNNNFYSEKRDIINFIRKQLERIADTQVKGLEYIIRVFNCLQKGIVKTGSDVFNTLLNKLSNVMPEMHLPGYNFCGPFTKLDERLARDDAPVNKLDAGCKNIIYFTEIIKTLEKDILLIEY